MVVLCRITARCLCDIVHWNDHLVSMKISLRETKLTDFSMCEEVKQPSIQVPRAMVFTICLNWLCGFIFLIALTFVIPNLVDLAALASGQPTPVIILSAVGKPGAAFALLVPLLVLAIFCGIGCTTAASRCTWAFSRDGAIPGSKWWRQINPKLDVPLNAMMLSMVVQIILGVIYFGSPAAFNAFSGVGVICLTTSYAVPIAVSLIGGRSHIKHGNFDMGVLGLICNIVSLGKFCLNLYSQRGTNLSYSMERSRHSSLLHAILHSHHCTVHELRFSRVCSVLHRLHRLVLYLG